MPLQQLAAMLGRHVPRRPLPAAARELRLLDASDTGGDKHRLSSDLAEFRTFLAGEVPLRLDEVGQGRTPTTCVFVFACV